MLRKQVIALPVSSGINAGETDPHHVEGAALRLENVRIPRKKASAKRYGTRKHTYSATNHNGLATLRDRPFAYKNGTANMFEGTLSAGSWKTSQGTINEPIAPEMSVTNIDGSATVEIYFSECCHNTNYVAVVYNCVSGGSHSAVFQAYHRETMLRVQSSSSALTASLNNKYPARVAVTADGDIAAFYVTGGAVKMVKLGSNGTWGAAATITMTHAPADYGLDVVPAQYGSGDSFYVAYQRSSDSRITVAIIDYSSEIETATYNNASVTAPTNRISMCWVNQTSASSGMQSIYVAWANNTDLACVELTSALAEVTAVATKAVPDIKKVSVCMDVGVGSFQNALIFAETKASNAISIVRAYEYTGSSIDAAASGTTSGEVIRGVTVVSNPFYCNGEIVMWVAHQGGGWWKTSISDIDKSTVQRTLFLVRIGYRNSLLALVAGHNSVGKALVNASGYNLASTPSPTYTPEDYGAVQNCSVITRGASTSQVYIAALKYNGAQKNSIAIINTVDDMGLTGLSSTGDIVLIPGSKPSYFDGQSERAQSIEVWPEGITVADSGGGGGTWPNTGTIGFRVVYEFTDASGRVVQSRPSPTVSYSLTATTQQPQVTFPAPNITDTFLGTNLRSVIYMTEIDGNIFYRRETLSYTATTSTAYTSAGGIVTTSGDGTVSVTEPLYTDGGVLPCDPARPHYVSTIFQNRLFYVDGELPKTRTRYTREIRPDRGIPHSEFLYYDTDALGGEKTGLIPFDEKLIEFKERAIYAVHGEGPDDTGGSSQYSRPRLISSSIGMPNRRCVTEIPQGLLFASSDGFYLLDHSENLIPDRRAKYYTDTYTIRAATTDPSKHLALFATDGGPTIVYDYQFDSWSTWTSAYNDIRDIAYVADNLWAVSDAGYTYVMDSSAYTDDGSGYAWRNDTEWFRMDQLREFRIDKVYLLGYNPVDSTINIKYAYNYDPTWKDGRSSDQKDLDLSALQNFSHTDYFGDGLSSSYDDQAVIVQSKGSKQRVKAVRFSIYDSAPSGGSQGQGFEVTAIVLVVRAKEQSALIGDTRKAA